MRKTLIFFLLLAAISTQAQEITFWHRVKGFFTRRAVVDTAYIYQPEPGFSLGLFGTLQQAGFNTDVNFRVCYDDNESFSGVTSYWLSEDLCKKVGVEVGYGNINIGYGFEVGTKSATQKSSFAFNLLRKNWGVRINYYKITNPFTSGLTIGIAGDEHYQHDEFVSKELASLRSFTIDGYYVFNNKRFAFPATYKRSLIQRHMFYFRSSDAINASQMNIPEFVKYLNFYGTFQDWMLKGLAVYRF